MSQYNQGILGPFSGKTGTVVGSFWKGRWVMRGRPTHMSNPRTPAQQAVRARFSIVSSAVAALRTAINVGFKLLADVSDVTPANKAMQVNIEQAVTGSGTSVTIDYSRFMISGGQLLNVEAPSVVLPASGHSVNISWTNNAGVDSDVLDTDQVCFALYNPARQSATFDLVTASRDDESATMDYPALWAGDTLYLFAFTHSTDNTRISPSVLVGSVIAQ